MNIMKELTNDELLNTIGGEPPPPKDPDTSVLPKPPVFDPYAAPGMDPVMGLELAI